MATLDILVLQSMPDDEVVAEAVSVLQWAAEAGPFSIGIDRMTLFGAPLPEVAARARLADAVLVGPGHDDVTLQTLRRELGATVCVRAPGTAAQASAPTAWLGDHGAVYTLGDTAGIQTTVVAAMQAAALLLEYSAARYGLADSIRGALAEVAPRPSTGEHGVAWALGQRVLERLDERFVPCAGW